MNASDDRVAVEAAAVWPEDVDEEEGVVVNWFAREGRIVTEGEPVCEIQIEKVDVDVPAPAGGELVEVVLGEDAACTRGATLGWIAPK
ncbi:MAG: lipoyl domain-containing protein [Halalkalicoccus sp.]|nr:lipoyl domain-containing protein [Halalkalicoccus sp.]